MPDNLRDRIAKAVFDGFTTHPSEYLVMSITDSVIRELGMHRENVEGEHLDDDPALNGAHRYVTEWIDDD